MPVLNNVLAGSSGQTSGGAATSDYTIEKSLRLNSSDTPTLSTTFSSVGNRKTWTWSGWIKRNKLTLATQTVLFAGVNTSGNGVFYIYFNSDDTLTITGGVNGVSTDYTLTTTQVFRDPSSWYHFVFAFDTTQSTAADRFKFYVNGTLVDSFSTSNYPGPNYEGSVNNAVPLYVGSIENAAHTNACFADVHFIDGEALQATDFGETDATTGAWKAKEFAGSYKGPYYQGSPFSEMTSTSGNYSQYQSQDPTNLFDGDTGDGWQFSGTTASAIFTPTTPISYNSQVRVYIGATGNSANTRYKVNGGAYQSFPSSGAYWLTILTGSGTFSSFELYQNGDPYTMAMNAIEIDGTILVDGQGANSFRLSFEDSSSTKTLGYDRSVNPNLNPDAGMAVVTYTGNGSTQDISTGFQPDFVWFKQRTGGSFNGGRGHEIVDSVRGLGKGLDSSSDGIEFTSNSGLTAYNSNGFTIGSEARVNENNASHVAWAWKAGGAASTNNVGSRQSTVSANTDYGFSIVTYTGTVNAETVGHGLNTAPSLIIAKCRTQSGSSANWAVYSSATGASNKLYLNGTIQSTSSGNWNSTAPTSSVFSVGGDAETNRNGQDQVAYCWSEVSGFSKISNYSGNGSTQKITFGFRPKYVLIKRTDAADDWYIFDDQRVSGTGENLLRSNTAAAENSAYDYFSFDDDGITLTQGNTLNGSGRSYLYAAFADRPGNNFDLNNLVATSGNTISASTVSLTAPSGGFLSGRDSKTYVLDGDTNSYLLANNSGDNYSVNFSPGITVNSSVEIYGLTAGQSASTNLSSSTSYTADQYTTLYSGSGTLTQITMIASGGRPGLAKIRVDGVELIATNVESGVDSLRDSPTNYNDGTNVGGNFATWNPLDNGGVDLSNGNLDVSNGAAHEAVRATFKFPKTGKWYCECTHSSFPTSPNVFAFGVSWSTASTPPGWSGSDVIYVGINATNRYINTGGSDVSNVADTTDGAVLQVAYDADAEKLWLGFNNNWYDSSYGFTGNPSTGANATKTSVTDIFPIGNFYNSTGAVNFGQRKFTFTPPTNFKSLCTQNFSATITKGKSAMDVTTYSGNGSTQSINNYEFEPDLLWIKETGDTGGTAHYLSTKINGVNKSLQTSSTQTETTDHPYGYVSATTSNGFTVTNGSSASFYVNGNNQPYVAWAWNADTAFSNSAGSNGASIASSGLSNASAGFSIVKYTADGTNSTVFHNLNAVPELVIIKGINANVENWKVYHKDFGSSGSLHLNLVSYDSSSTAFNGNPTSNVFGIGIHGATNQNTKDYLALCFTSVEGYCKVGSYTGNASATDPTFVYLGFKPRFLMVKGASTYDGGGDLVNGYNWFMYDSKRSPYNVADDILGANKANEQETAAGIDFLSNGFKVRNNNAPNAAVSQYYIAFAEHPFSVNGGLAR